MKTSNDAITQAEPEHKYGHKRLNKTGYTKSTSIQPMHGPTPIRLPLKQSEQS